MKHAGQSHPSEECRKLPQLRVERTQGEVLVIICDSELIGKNFEEGDLKLKVKRSFYEGKEATAEECLKALKEATIANMVGSIVERAVKAGFVHPSGVIRIQNVPHAQMVRL